MYLQDENTKLREMIKLMTNPLPPATPNPAGGGAEQDVLGGGGAEEEEQVAGGGTEGTEDQGAGWGDVGTSGLLTSSPSQ